MPRKIKAATSGCSFITPRAADFYAVRRANGRAIMYFIIYRMAERLLDTLARFDFAGALFFLPRGKLMRWLYSRLKIEYEREFEFNRFGADSYFLSVLMFHMLRINS